MSDIYTISSPDSRLRGTVDLRGGVLSSLTWSAQEGAEQAIFYRAPWLDEDAAQQMLPPLFQHLAGEWVGVPFGCVQTSDNLFSSDAPHGLPVNGHWQCQCHDQHSIQLRYDYEQDYPLQRLLRRIDLQNDGVVDFSLTIHARDNCQFPVGIHPIFPSGGEAGNVIIDAGESDGGITYPYTVEPGSSQALPGSTFSHLSEVPAVAGGYLDLRKLPLSRNTEEIVQLLKPHSPITLRYPKSKLRIELLWDTRLLPHCLLWISNGGRKSPPWEGKNFCLGVEPVCSAWDLGPDSMTPNLLQQSGARTCIALQAGEQFTVKYQLRCSTYC